MSIASRSSRLVNLGEFTDTGIPEKIKHLSLACPKDRQYILRMPVRVDSGAYHIPAELDWVRPAFFAALNHQNSIGANHPFCYITVRSGVVESQTDDEWHVDGFSTRIAHVPEQNYIWCSEVGTEYAPLRVAFPRDFDPLAHNVNKFLEKFVDSNLIASCEARAIYCMDPYILHRRPSQTNKMHRTFLRISFVPIEINDVNNTQNAALPRVYTQDGVSYRNTLSTYSEAKPT